VGSAFFVWYLLLLDADLSKKVAQWYFADIEYLIHALGSEADGQDRNTFNSTVNVTAEL